MHGMRKRPRPFSAFQSNCRLLSEVDYLETARLDSLILPNGLDKRRSLSIQNNNHSLVTEEITKSTTNSENTPESSNSPLVASEPAAIKEIDNNDWLIPAIEKVGLKYIDKRTTGGNLWVIGDRKIVTIISELNKKGAHFRYRESGGMATKGRSAWWMK